MNASELSSGQLQARSTADPGSEEENASDRETAFSFLSLASFPAIWIEPNGKSRRSISSKSTVRFVVLEYRKLLDSETARRASFARPVLTSSPSYRTHPVRIRP